MVQTVLLSALLLDMMLRPPDMLLLLRAMEQSRLEHERRQRKKLAERIDTK